MITAIETDIRQPISLTDRIDSTLREHSSGSHRDHDHVLQSKRRLSPGEDISYIYLDTPIDVMLEEDVFGQIVENFPYKPQETAQISLIRSQNARIFRMAVFARDRKSPTSIWKTVIEEGKDPITVFSNGASTYSVESTLERMDAFSRLIAGSEFSKRKLEDYVEALLIDGEKQGANWSIRDIDEIKGAARIAWDSHKGQYRKSGEPYFAHPFEGARNLLRLGLGTPKRIKMNLLHDAPEDDPKLKQPEIAEGEDKAPESYSNWVRRITHVFARYVGFQAALGSVLLAKPRPDGIDIPSPERASEVYQENISSSEDTILVKVLGDRCHNIMTLWAMPPANIRKTIRETREKYIPLVRPLVSRYPQIEGVIERMEREMQELETRP